MLTFGSVVDPCGRGYLQHQLSSLSWDPTGRLLGSCATERELKLWSHRQANLMCEQILEHAQPVTCLTWCQDHRPSAEGGHLLLAR